ncbi:guanitoxin biosynthesis MATE family efflux transporter GntT [Coleofasciculus chthonoplastes]|uniref:guanitoxin biosynthesis MATE family efflux transporter GntT n=1 Tax=Coleofasciculus chthonoplastes TaxID=64178 RepID=UPI0032F5181C
MTLILTNHYDFIPRFYRLAIINILSNLMIPLAGLISVAFLGHLSEISSLAGVSLANIIFNVVYLTLAFLRMATTGVTAQAVGADDRQEILLIGLRNGLIALTLGMILVICQYPLREIGFSLLNADVTVKESAINYFNARIWGAPAVLLNFVLIGWLLGREKNSQVLILSFFGNAFNVLLDYVFILQLNWESKGAGTSLACSQYLMCFIALIFSNRDFSWQEIKTGITQIFEPSAIKQTFSFNRDILISNISELSVLAFFGKLSAMMGTITFTQNFLLGQISHLSVYLTDGLVFATETLSGNFKGQKSSEKFLPLLRVAMISSLILALTIAIICVLFPHTIFSIFTNKSEINSQIHIYIWWLFFLLTLASASTMLEGYFVGLADGKVVRDTSLLASVWGFIPPAVATWYLHNNHVLWLSMTLFLLVKTVALLVYLVINLTDGLSRTPFREDRI